MKGEYAITPRANTLPSGGTPYMRAMIVAFCYESKQSGQRGLVDGQASQGSAPMGSGNANE